MRILLLIKSFDFGGAENHVRDLANQLEENDNEVFVISAKGSQTERLNRGIHFRNLKMSDIFSLLQIIYLCRFLSVNKIDVIHAHKRLAVFLGSVAGKIMRVPVVATVHGRPRYDLRSRISRKFTDSIIFVSKRTIDANRELLDIIKKSVFIPNGVEIRENTAQRDYYSVSYICRIDKKHSSVITMLIRDVLPEILREFPQVSLNIIGDGKYLKALTRKAEEMNTFHKKTVCKIRGYVTEVKPEIKRSGIVLGVGRVAIEALSCSVPVILLNQRFLGGFITEQNFHFYKHSNFVAVTHNAPDSGVLTEILREYFKNPAHYQAEASGIVKLVRENFCIKKISSDIMAVYINAVESKKTTLWKRA
ncbi:MAG: glycosyltransferase [Bacteroidales bacterium]|jgi:glycosyltransferase involved in cell wall biosynthesis|nr:glycosyltransferase [Bacteroidales bacterium]